MAVDRLMLERAVPGDQPSPEHDQQRRWHDAVPCRHREPPTVDGSGHRQRCPFDLPLACRHAALLSTAETNSTDLVGYARAGGVQCGEVLLCAAKADRRWGWRRLSPFFPIGTP